MRYVVHGDDLISSRSYLASLKKKYKNTINLDGEKLGIKGIDEAIRNRPLSPDRMLTVVENYPSQEKTPSGDSSSDYIFWWSRTLREVPKAEKIIHFKDQSAFGIFRFSDSVGQRQIKPAMLLLSKLLEEKVPPEKIMAVLTRQLKMIAQILDGGADKVSTSQFVQKKLVGQAKQWDLKRTQEGLAFIFQTDLKIKRGKAKKEIALTDLVYHLCK
jgi:hypothetical protein